MIEASHTPSRGERALYLRADERVRFTRCAAERAKFEVHHLILANGRSGANRRPKGHVWSGGFCSFRLARDPIALRGLRFRHSDVLVSSRRKPEWRAIARVGRPPGCSCARPPRVRARSARAPGRGKSLRLDVRGVRPAESLPGFGQMAWSCLLAHAVRR